MCLRPPSTRSPNRFCRHTCRCSDTGVAALSCCLWITQLLSVVHGRQSRAFSKVRAVRQLLCPGS